MKTKIKRMSKRTLAMLLGVLMLVTSIGLGTIITVNATTYYIWKSSNNAFNNDGGVTQNAMNGSSAPWTYSFYLAKTTNTYFRISTSNSSSTSGNIVSSDNVTFLGDNINSSEISDYDSSKLFRVNLKEAGTVTISYDGTTITVTSGDTSGGNNDSGSGSDTKRIYVGVIEYIIDETYGNNNKSVVDSEIAMAASKLEVHYWGGATSDDANLTYMSTTKSISVGSSYWDNAAQTFYMYYAEIPSDSTGMKVRDGDTWYGNDGDATTNNTIYVFNYGGCKANYDKTLNNSTGTLIASPSSITSGASSILTSSITNTEQNEIGTPTYNITNQPSGGDGSISNGIFTATVVGTYTLNSTFYYYAKGFYGTTDNSLRAQLTPTTTINVTAATYNNITATTNIDGAATNNISISTPSSAVNNVNGNTGTTVTAVNNDSSKYTFTGWTSDNGTFTNPSNLSTTFKPTANNAVAIANFEENSYTITVNKGTNGSSVSPSSITAHPYTTYDVSGISVTPNSGYQFSSWTPGTGVTISNGKLTATQASSITANYTKQSYTLSKGSENNGTFTLSPSAGTVEYETEITVTCKPNNGYTVGSVTSTGGGTASGSGNTWKVNMPASNTTINVSFIKKDNAITKAANPSGGGTVEVYSQATGSTTKGNYQIGDTIYPRATPNAAYNFSKFVISYANGSEDVIPVGSATKNGSYYYYPLAMDTAHFTNDNDGSITVTGYFTAKPTYDIIPKSNNKLLGTVSTNVTSAYEGQVITVTPEEQTGTFSSVAIKKMSDNSDVTSEVNYNSSTKQFTMPAYAVRVEATFTEYSGESDFYYNGYSTSGTESSYYAKPMSEGKLNGVKYGYYHVTGRSGWNQNFTVSYGKTDYSDKQIYFQIADNWDDNEWPEKNYTQEAWFVASDGVSLGKKDLDFSGEYDSSHRYYTVVPNGARSVYFKETKNNHQTVKIDLDSTKNGGYNAWRISGNQDSSGGRYVTGWDIGGYKVGNEYEYFKGTGIYTDTTDHSFNDYNVTIGGSHSVARPSTDASDYYILVLYQNNTYNINGKTITVGSTDPKVVWTSTLPQPEIESDVQTVDILAKNGSLRDSTFNRFTNLANTQIVDDYFEYTDADGITYNSISSYNTVADQEIEITHDSSYGNSNYDKIVNVPVGAKIKLRTTLSSDATKAGSFDGKAFKDTHYLKGYSFNGMTYQVHEKNDTGVYEEIWTVRAVNTTYKDSSGDVHNATTGGKTIEVTPIYYMKDNTNCKTFYIDGYDGEVQNAWGNMLSVYPYYEGLSNSANAFGGYPGQPMLFWGGKYQMEIPLTVDGTAQGATVKGLTLHNSYWDLLHRSIDIRCNTRNHAQTYDYDDFYKLYKEKNPDTIIFDFKYRTSADNYNDGYDYTDYDFAGSAAKAASDASLTNGVELVTDYFGRQVDAFGTLIIDSKKSDYDTSKSQDSELLFVSTGYKDTYVGEYATIWAVYAPTTGFAAGDSANKFIGYISSSMLYLNNIDRRLQYSDGDNTASGRMSWEQFVDTYNHLKNNYKGVPVLISYEKEIWNDSKDKAFRSDGKWYYSNKSDKISSNIIIQYGAHSLIEVPDHSVSSNAWTTDAFDDAKTGVGGEKNIGTTTGCSAYFTNTTPNIKGKVASGEQFADSTKKFTFEANAAGQYQFAGWVRLSNGKYYEISETEVGESDMSSNDTYIARFVVAQTGSLTIQHVVEQTDTFTGDGTAAVTVTVSDASGTQLFTDTKSDGSKIDISKYIDSRRAAYKIDISLTTTPSGESFMKEIVSSASGVFVPGTTAWNADKTATNSTGADTSAKTATVAQFTVQDVLTAGVSSVRYVSHLMKPKYIYQYEITYTYKSRFWGNQTYTVSDTFNDEDNFTGSKTNAKLNTDFIENSTPFEKNLKQTINWNYTDSTVDGASPMVNNKATLVSGNTYKMTAQVYSSNTVNDKVKAEFILPYSYSFNKTDGFNANSSDVYTAANGTATGDKVVIYDEKNKSTTLTAQAYKLFTYENDEGVQGGDGILASQLKLVQAAPSVVKNATYHTKQVSGKRYYTGNSFKVGDITYYKSEDDVPKGATNYEVLTATDTVTVVKPEKVGQPGYVNTTYHYAVQDGTDGPVYFFAYNVNENDEPVDNANNVITDPKDYVFNGQYIVYSVSNVNDGIVQGTGETKYFTRWDIFNSKGDLITSSYSKRFNYSGYENYIIKAVYDSSEPHNGEYNGETGTSSTISYLGDTRNQWKGSTDAASGNFASVTGQTATTEGDKLLHDFAISYYYNGKEIKSIDKSDAEIKVGMLIEKLGALDSSGSSKITDSSYYADKYKGDINVERFTKMTKAIKSGRDSFNLTNSDSTKNATVNSKIGNNIDNSWGTLFTNSSGASSAMNFNSVIDNMNRLKWAYTFNNTKTDGVIGANNNANFAYRAWSYIIVGDTVTISSTPAYFTLYDSAHR